MAKSILKRLPPKKRPRKAKANTRGAGATEALLPELTGAALETKAAIERAGGVVVGQYAEPIGQHPLLLAVLPIASVEPTPFQRDVSDMHHKKLADVIDRTGMFLDPIIAITAPKEGFWTPNGGHRLAAMRRLGAKSITALVVPKREVAWQILALNTEKAHNLKDKSLEVIRIFRNLLEDSASKAEKDFSYYFEEGVAHHDGPLLRAEAALQRRRLQLLRPPPDRLQRRLAHEIPQGPRAHRHDAAGARREGRRGRGQAEGEGLCQSLFEDLRRRPLEPAALHEGAAGARRAHQDDPRQGRAFERGPHQAGGHHVVGGTPDEET